MTLEKIYELVERGVLEKHHSATHPGYVRTNEEQILIYHGRFGNGYKVLEHNYRSNRYCIVTYFTEV